MKMVELRDVAPPLASDRSLRTREKVWLLNLDQIEAQTGRILSKVYSDASNVGSSTQPFDNGNVLFSKLRPYLNKVVLPDESGVATTELVPLRPDPKRLERSYLAYYLRSPSFVAWATNEVAGAKMPRLVMQSFWKQQIPLPPLAEQKRIAAILDKADAIRRKLQQSLRLSDDFLRSVFLDMFGDPVTNPKGWNEVPFGELVESTKLGMVRSSTEFGWDMPVPYVRMDALNNDGGYLPEKVQGTQATKADIAAYGLEPGDFLFNTRNSKELVGKVAVYPGPSGATFNNNLMRIRFKKADPYFVCHQFQFPRVQRELEARKQGTTSVFAVYWKNLATLPVLSPPEAKQKEFRKACDKIEKSRSTLSKQLSEANHLFSSLQQRAFRGEL